MIQEIPIEFLTMSTSAVGGFLMKLKAVESERRQQERIHTIEAFKARMEGATPTADAAAGRLDSFGKFTRRALAFGLLFAVVALPFLAPLLDVPTVIETTKKTGGFFFGLFGEGSRVELQTVTGYLHTQTVLLGFAHVVAFYFGQGAAKP